MTKARARHAWVCRRLWWLVLGTALVADLRLTQALTPSVPIVIKGQSGVVISGVNITSTAGPCVQIINSTNITIQGSTIGPCGTNNTTQNSWGIAISDSRDVYIYDNYIHVENLASACCDTHDGIMISTTANVVIQGNIIAYSESNIEAQSGTSGIFVIGNFLLNPRNSGGARGQQFQSSGATDVTVQNNYAVSSMDNTLYSYPENQEDAINFWHSNTFTVQGNYVVGGHSATGCGIMIDDQANNGQILSNIVSNTGQCGIGIADGVGHVVDSNKVLNLTPVAGGGNTAVYVWLQYAAPCGGSGPPKQITVSNNIADEVQSNGYHSGWWDGGGCGQLNMFGNTWGSAAYGVLYPMAATNPPPLIPPQPYACVTVSPYSTQTSKRWCSEPSTATTPSTATSSTTSSTK